VEYAPAPGGPGAIALLGWLMTVNLLMLPSGKSIKGYGISASYKRNKKPFIEDLSLLFGLLAERKIRPIIANKFPILEAAKANELLESGKAIGNIVLLAPELL
jgi:NADPH:quinone reductase-like Zn-dependent oxidoreductase